MASDTMRLRIVTWNLNCRTRALPDQVALLISLEPDLVLLQEVTRTTDRNLATRLADAGLSYYLSTAEDTQSGPRRMGVAIASRRPIVNVPHITSPEWPERLLIVQGEHGTFLNAHMPTGCSHGLKKVDMLEATYAVFVDRSTEPAILAGDFNCPQEEHPELITWGQSKRKDGTWHVVKSKGERWDRAERRYFDGTIQDAYRMVHGQNPACSWVLRRKEKTFPRRFDHIFISSHWKAHSAEYRAIDRKLSDHALLVVEVERE